MKKTLIVLGLILLGLLFSNFFGFWGANPKVRRKVSLIREAMERDGYEVKWITISEKRNRIYNSLLANSAKKSHHLEGNAIDVFVFDIDGDGRFDKRDVDVVRRYNKMVENRHPELKGALGSYLSKPIAKRMIHFDTGGRSRSYDK